jgi:type III pantothenate kinase
VTVVLDLDAGNTRVKWRVSEAGALRARGALPTAEVPGTPPEAWAGVERARLVTVGPSPECLGQWLHGVGIAEVDVARAGARAGRLRSGYREPERLGADRWVALAGAAARCDGPFAVVDAGSALTVDLVDRDGLHLGGWIVPGLALMQDALLRGTAGVRFVDEGDIRCGRPGRDTREAVLGGLRTMVADFVGLRWAHHRQGEAGARLFLTGGDGPLLAPALGAEAELLPDLVLDGLEAVLG